MNGAQALFKALTDAGLDTCFANPGTSEMQLVYEMGRTKDTRAILCLEENVVTGAADGYAHGAQARVYAAARGQRLRQRPSQSPQRRAGQPRRSSTWWAPTRLTISPISPSMSSSTVPSSISREWSRTRRTRRNRLPAAHFVETGGRT